MVQGQFLGTFKGSDSNQDLASLLAPFGVSAESVTQSAKVDINTQSNSTPHSIGDMTVTTSSSKPWNDGTWTFTGDWTVNFVVAKAANQFHVWDVRGVDTGSGINQTGCWSSMFSDACDASGSDILLWKKNTAKLSHLTLYGGSEPSPVPVPAAVWLFGSALLGLIGIGRRKI